MKNISKIIICGQTATGKTSLALKLAQKYNSEIISADSRQIYLDMNIGTGKISEGDQLTKKDEQWYLNEIPVHGVNLVTPDKMYSSGEFAHYGKNVMQAILEKNKIPIIVGGTGFYIKSLLRPDQTISIPLNLQLRDQYEEFEKNNTLEAVREKMLIELKKHDPEKLDKMNNSDKNNPRRLIRAIEVALWNKDNLQTHKPNAEAEEPGEIWTGLTAPREFLQEKITTRVKEMVNQGMKEEIEKLLKTYTWDSPGLKTIGYKEWKEHFESNISIEEVMKKIITSHLQYARRQMIYFKRFPFIQWIDISKPDIQIVAESFLQRYL